MKYHGLQIASNAKYGPLKNGRREEGSDFSTGPDSTREPFGEFADFEKMASLLQSREYAVHGAGRTRSPIAGPLSHAQAHARQFVSELMSFVHFPSVSAQPKHANDVKNCAAWLAAHLRGIGLENVAVVPTARHPIVYGDWRHAPGPTVLIYGHYDVQPADPLSEWRSPPFEPAVRGEDLFGRGASDDKGQLFAHIKAVESCLRAAGRLPVNAP